MHIKVLRTIRDRVKWFSEIIVGAVEIVDAVVNDRGLNANAMVALDGRGVLA